MKKLRRIFISIFVIFLCTLLFSCSNTNGTSNIDKGSPIQYGKPYILGEHNIDDTKKYSSFILFENLKLYHTTLSFKKENDKYVLDSVSSLSIYNYELIDNIISISLSSEKTYYEVSKKYIKGNNDYYFLYDNLILTENSLNKLYEDHENEKSSFLDVRVQNGDALKSIALALDPVDEKEYSKALHAKEINGFDQTSPTYLFAAENGTQFAAITKLHNAPAGDISYEKTYGYSFYIVNTTSNYQDVTVKLKLIMSKDDGLSKAIRVMTYYEMGGAQNFKVYQKTDTDSNGNPMTVTYDAYDMIEARSALMEFEDGASTIFEGEEIVVSGTAGNNYVRYTILFWLEGDDPDCNEDILGKSARFELEADVIA